MTEAQQRAYDQAQIQIAFSQGKKIQCKSGDGEWNDCNAPYWSWPDTDYRIAPEPQEVWLWVKEGINPNCCSIFDAPDICPSLTKGYTKKLFREVP